ncbi:reverse transcriptase [Senna tora]|uniref:Reverse transcriptase n=1 Tax=Senna tora TaxID=362788 RepID=A0A834TNQ7_9FABA|nr:reverse transcriptase [Senna tora]
MPCLKNFQIATTVPNSDWGNRKVNSLIQYGKWMLGELNNILTSEEILAIERLPISDGHVEDEIASSSVVFPDGLWSAIWNLKVAEKVKHFIWRLCYNILPTRVNLMRKRCGVSTVRPVCNLEEESSEYLLLFCGWTEKRSFSATAEFWNANISSSRVSEYLIVRNCDGRVVDGRCFRAVTCSARMAEALALRESLKTALELQLEDFCVESDCKELVLAVNKKDVDWDWQCSNIMKDILLLCGHLRWPSVLHVRRNANKAADWLARSVSLRMCPLDHPLFWRFCVLMVFVIGLVLGNVLIFF